MRNCLFSSVHHGSTWAHGPSTMGGFDNFFQRKTPIIMHDMLHDGLKKIRDASSTAHVRRCFCSRRAAVAARVAARGPVLAEAAVEAVSKRRGRRWRRADAVTHRDSNWDHRGGVLGNH